MKYVITCNNCHQVMEFTKKPEVQVNERHVNFNKTRRKHLRSAREELKQAHANYHTALRKKVNIPVISGILKKDLLKTHEKNADIIRERIIELEKTIDSFSERRPTRYIVCPLCEQKIHLY